MNSHSRSQAQGSDRVVMSIRALSIALLGVAIMIMSLHFAEYLRYAISSVDYRYETFDAEGIVWQQAMLIPGPRMYGDITQYPFIVFHYPPVYHLLSRALSLLGCTAAGLALAFAIVYEAVLRETGGAPQIASGLAFLA